MLKETPVNTGGCGLIRETLHQFSESLGNAIDARDHGTRFHSEQVAEVSHLLAQRMGLPDDLCMLIHIAGHLHDIGKIGLADSVLKKAGPLTDAEWQLVKEHPQRGASIVRPVPEFAVPGGVADIILAHHERWDAKGYPHGLSGPNIPLGARIIAVADGLSAMMQDRPYRQGMPFDEACREIQCSREKQYDPAIVDVFIQNRRAVFEAMISVT